jgi:NAD(P)-dependent dehydrogenase (short-subunit alcohol dehydrogenase family)
VDFKNKVVLVTGGLKGIGFACAKQFVEQGANVIISARVQEDIDSALTQLPRAMGFSADLTNEDEASAFVEHVQQAFDRIDVLVNSAGAAKRTPVNELNPKAWRAAIDAKFFSTINVLDLVIKQMAAQVNSPCSWLILRSLGSRRLSHRLPSPCDDAILLSQYR